MVKSETTKLLTLVSSIWPNFIFNAQTIDAWTLLLSEYDFIATEAAIYAAIKTQMLDLNFAPSAAKIVSLMQAKAKPAQDDALIAYKQGGGQSELGRQAWKIWGGDSRWGALPCPERAETAAQINQAAQAEKDFIRIYESLAKKTQHENFAQLADNTPNNVTDMLSQLACRKQLR